MIRFNFTVFAVATAVFLTGCKTEQDQNHSDTRSAQQYPPSPASLSQTEPTPPPEAPSSEPGSSPSATPVPPPPTAAAPTGNIPYGKPVAGKPGFVISPYSPDAGYVDVRGFPPGTEVKDPYTQKVFLVP